MATELTTINNNLVVRDSNLTWRWFDAFGPNVVKWFLNPVNSPVVSTTTAAGADVDAYTAGTMVSADSISGGGLNFVTSGTEDQGLQAQWGEGFYFAQPWPAYFGCKFACNDITQVDFLLGLAINDEEVIGGLTDGIYFRTADAATSLGFVLEKNSAEVETAVATLVDDTVITAEWYYDGSTISAYVNGALAVTLGATNVSFCNDEHLAALIAIATGEASAQTLTVYWARAIQVQSGT